MLGLGMRQIQGTPVALQYLWGSYQEIRDGLFITAHVEKATDNGHKSKPSIFILDIRTKISLGIE